MSIDIKIKNIAITCVISLFTTLIVGCIPKTEKEDKITSFFGDKVLNISANNTPNGYKMDIIKTNEICLAHLQKADSINVYIALPVFPNQLNAYYDSIGYYKVFLDVPHRSELKGDMFFMDVNFDDEPELIVAVPGYNKTYFWCYDIKNSDKYTTSGFLEPIRTEPFDNLVISSYEDFPCAETVFDYEKKTIQIDESVGVSEHITTIAEYYSPEGEPPFVRVIYKEIRKRSPEGLEIMSYALFNDTLKLAKHEYESWN